MLAPDIPQDETHRLKSLKDCHLLDSPPEERFDRLTRLLKNAMAVDIVLISLIDQHRQWFKSAQGLDVPETPRDISFCGHTILSDQIMQVSDALNDVRFADNPLVTGAPHIRFYAGAPIHAPNGHRLGTLCLIDRRPRSLDAAELQTLKDFAACIEHEIASDLGRRQQDALLALTRITSLPFEEPRALLRETLALGCQYLQMTNGVISEVREQEVVIRALHSDRGLLSEGESLPKRETFSDLLTDQRKVLFLHHISQSEFRNHASSLRFHQESYIGIPLYIGGRHFGTLAFSSEHARQIPFTSVEIEFINVLGDWINSILKRIALDQSLQLSQSLNEAITDAQLQFIRDREKSFEQLLKRTLELTESGYGLICDIRVDASGLMKKNATIAEFWPAAPSISQNEQLPLPSPKMFLREHPLMDKLCHGNIVLLDNRHLADPVLTSAGISTLIGLPVMNEGILVAVIILANRQQAYDPAIRDLLQPLPSALGQLINAAGVQRQHEEAQKRLANIIEGTNAGTWEFQVQKGRILVNARWAEMLGYDADELTEISSEDWLQRCHPDDAIAARRAMELHLRGELPYFDLISRMKHRQGDWIWVRDRGCTVNWDEHQHAQLVSGSRQNVTLERLAEEKLAHAYELLEQSNEAAQIGTWEYDVHSGTLHWSAMTRLIHEVDEDFRCTPQQSLQFYKNPEQRQLMGRLFRDAATRGQRFDAEMEIVTARHAERWVRVIGLPQLKNGEVYRIYGTFQNISDSKASAEALRDQAAHTQAILDNVLDGIITVNHYGYIDSFNAAASHIFGYRREEIIGKHVSILLPFTRGRSRTEEMIRPEGIDLMIGTSREIEARRKDGNLFPLDLSISAVRRRGRPFYIGLMRDITERKRLEKIKNEFISTVSHELRTPLTSISGALGLILGGVTGDLPVSLMPLLNIASKNSQRLTFLINDLLDMEKLSAGKMHFNMQRQRLLPLLQQAVETNTTFSAQRHIRLQLRQPLADVMVDIDSQRLMQVLSNLLSNAIKYSPENETVLISAEPVAGHVKISVSDKGNGIPAEFRDRIFQKFAQADSSDTREKGGTGLGLAISRELVEHMGGRIGFESNAGEGANFYIELPLVE